MGNAYYSYTATVIAHRNDGTQADSIENSKSGTYAGPQGSTWFVYVAAPEMVERTGYRFLGYSESEGSTVVKWQPGDTLTFMFSSGGSQNIHIYSVWQRAYVINYNKGTYGTGDNAADYKDSGASITIRGETFTRENYTQTAWATSDGGNKAYDFGDTYTSDADLTLYPVWSPSSGSVRYMGADNLLHAGTVHMKGADGNMHDGTVYVKGADGNMHQMG